MRLMDFSLGMNKESLKLGVMVFMWWVDIGNYLIVWLQYSWQDISQCEFDSLSKKDEDKNKPFINLLN